MKKTFILFFLFLCNFVIIAQDNTEKELEELNDNKKYDEMIKYASKKELSAKSLYYVGLAYYMKEDDNNSIKYMDLSIGKDSKSPKPYYIKGSTLNYMDKFEEAIKNFQISISLRPEHGESYNGLGDAYYHLEKYSLAAEAYKKATELPNPSGRTYSMLGQSYSLYNENEKALEAFYIAKSKITSESSSYRNVIYNLGLLESLKGNNEKAEPMFKELIEIDPKDFQAYSKLIQIYYNHKEYEKAIPYKTKLYQAFKNKELKDNLKDMFCFDQFKWNGKSIQAYERFQEGGDDLYEKHIFYVLDDQGKIDYKIMTEYSSISVELGGSKYLLCRSKGNEHSTFNIGFNSDFNYDSMKKAVIAVLEEKVKPTATSTPR